MIEVLKENYDSFMQSNDKPLFGSDFDGETYRFFESKEEADSYQAHVLVPVDEPEENKIDMSNVDLTTMTNAQLDILVNILKSRL